MSNTWRRTNQTWLTHVSDSLNGNLPSGTYAPYIDSNGAWWYIPGRTDSDLLLDLPGLPIKYILDQMANFWDKTEQYKKYGFLQKRGIMLYGPPGCGKSSIVSLLREQLTNGQDGICFTPGNGFANMVSGIKNFRTLEPERKIMTLVEDIETILESSNNNNNAATEKAALAFYDGEDQVNNVVHIATTNKPDLVADRFIRRPGRFDLVIGVHAPTRETREAYLKHICNGALGNVQLTDILDRTDGLSLAYMREIAATYLVLEIPLDETIERLRTQAKAKYNTNKTGFTIGFTE